VSPLVPLTIYNLAAPLALGLMLPRSLRKIRSRGGYGGRGGDRLARYPKELLERLDALGEERPLFIQAVSVGEAAVASKLVAELKVVAPELPIVLGTTTPTGQAIARERVGHLAELIYSPIDLPHVARRCLEQIRPQRIVLIDSDLWPNLLWLAHGRGIPTSVVNARLSPRSESRFLKFARLTRPIFSLLDQVCVDDEADLARWAGLGVDSSRLVHTGSIKFDTASPPAAPASFSVLLDRTWPDRGPFLLGVSTHDGEELLFAEAWRALLKGCPDARLAIAPRHVERREEIAGALREAGFGVHLRTETSGPWQGGQPPVLLIDTTGELAAWQSLADFCVIGKSFKGRGGQNPAEAAAAGKVVVAGPHMENFEGLMQLLDDAGGVVRARDAAELTILLGALTGDPERVENLGASARESLSAHRGATERTVQALLGLGS